MIKISGEKFTKFLPSQDRFSSLTMLLYYPCISGSSVVEIFRCHLTRLLPVDFASLHPSGCLPQSPAHPPSRLGHHARLGARLWFLIILPSMILLICCLCFFRGNSCAWWLNLFAAILRRAEPFLSCAACLIQNLRHCPRSRSDNCQTDLANATPDPCWCAKSRAHQSILPGPEKKCNGSCTAKKNLDFLHQKRFATHPTFYNRLKTSFDIRYILLSLC